MPQCQYHCQRQRHNTAEVYTSGGASEFRWVVLSSFMRSYARTHPAARLPARSVYRLHSVRVHCFWFWFSRASTGPPVRLLRNEVVMQPTCRWITFWSEVWGVRYELLTLRTSVSIHVAHYIDVRFYAYAKFCNAQVSYEFVPRKIRESKYFRKNFRENLSKEKICRSETVLLTF